MPGRKKIGLLLPLSIGLNWSFFPFFLFLQGKPTKSAFLSWPIWKVVTIRESRANSRSKEYSLHHHKLEVKF